MYKGKKIAALIPARGGSKGIPEKNIRPLLGKPLIAWSIEQGLSSAYVDKVVVSTDDKRIAGIAKAFGAEVPFMRPGRLARDNSPTIDTVLHAIDHFRSQGDPFDILVLLEPTSPLREAEDIDKAIEMLVSNKKAESIVGIAAIQGAHPSFLVEMSRGLLKPYINKDFKVVRRQEIEELYFLEGSLYIAYMSSLEKRKRYYHEKTLGYVVPKWKAFEIDDYTDLVVAEAILNARKNGVRLE